MSPRTTPAAPIALFSLPAIPPALPGGARLIGFRERTPHTAVILSWDATVNFEPDGEKVRCRHVTDEGSRPGQRVEVSVIRALLFCT